MYVVYVLKSTVAKKSYVGITSNLEKRLKEHNSGKSFYSKRYAPWKVIYFEHVENRLTARVKEKYLKSAAGRRFLRLKVFKE